MLAYSKSFANFNTHKEFNIIQGKIPNKSGDIKLAVFVGGKKYEGEGFPSKEGHKFKGYECTNGVELKWNPETWSALIDAKNPTVCTLEFETADNLNLNGSEPVVKEGLVPVVIANDGTVTKTETDDINWYDYNESKWANAVLLTGTDIYQVGDTIPEEAIESYFVWIPKYRYKLFNVEGDSIPEQEIEIEIGDYNTTDTDTECKATNKSGDNGTCKNDMWMTHPAFTSLGVNGIWVGKFETTGTTDNITVKPNVVPLRNQTVSSMYNAAYAYKRGLDSHMMKNTEWGAMAYLTNSKYGRENTEVWINNYWNYSQTLTGCTGESVSAVNRTSCSNSYVPYATDDDQRKNNVYGSTTDNVSGIYDTSGASFEYVMGNYKNTVALSGINFSNIPVMYYDKYTTTDVSSRILGDATAETNEWNSDYASFFYSSSDPWLLRGGNYNASTAAGVFSFNCGYGGSASIEVSFRIVLSPAN